MSRRAQFETIRSEGALLPVDLLQRVAARDKDIGGLRGEDYGLPPNEPLNEAIVRSWNRLLGAWGSFRDARERLPEGDPGTSVTRDRWLLVLLQELDYGRVQTANAVEIEGKAYAVSHDWANVPIHLIGCNVPLDRRSRGVSGAATQSPHGTVQELLNRSEDRLWGFVSNGLLLRVLRDNSSLTRQAYLEFDLEQMLEGEVYADFVLLWLVCHASRVEGERAHESWLERWSQEAAKQGTRALEGLRKGVEDAIAALGSGFLQPGRNPALKAALRDGELAKEDYYRQLLRLVYRLLFLFVAEDRGLLHDPRASEEARSRYAEWYSTRRLRTLAERRRGTKHADLYEQLKLVMRGVGGDEGCPPLGLPPLGSFLWSNEALLHLDAATLPNAALLDAIRALATVRDGKMLRAVDYKSLGAEELGSVYESLLELHPDLDSDAGTFALTTAAGHERKTTGSYYTPSSLISVLLDSALDPVLDEAAKRGEQAILDLKVCDPACGSGHFLVAAAHRIAKRLASVRTGDEEPSPEATRQALRDAVSRCLYGVDVNPMAVELCKVSLWMEALDPGRPLSFLDAHIKCGNSLLGTTAALIANGIPDEAFKALEGDDKAVAKALRKQNKSEREGQLTFEDVTGGLVDALEAAAEALDTSRDDTPAALREKERRFVELTESETYERARLAMDAWCASFVARKVSGKPRITTGTVRRVMSGAAPPEVIAEVHRLACQYGLFQWEIEYPHVFGRDAGGFDVVFGNPPWERVKLQEKEFFANHPIAMARNAAERKRHIAALEDSDPALYASWRAALRRAEAESQFVRLSGRFPLCGRGDVNTYALFAELMSETCSADGTFGCVAPVGLVTDETTKHFFAALMNGERVASVLGFENEEKIFPTVTNRFNFCIFGGTGTRRRYPHPQFAFFLRRAADAMDERRRFLLTAEDIALVNQNSRTCPVFRSKLDAALTLAIYERVGVFVRDEPRVNPWGAEFLRLLDMANDSDLFRMEAAPARLPLYEAKMTHQFDHRFGDYAMKRADYGKNDLPTVPHESLADPVYRPTPQYWVDRSEVESRLWLDWPHKWVLGWRDITNTTNERTVVASVIPRVAVGHSFPLMKIDRPELASCLLANLNSFVLDYVCRRKLNGMHLTYSILEQLPVLSPPYFQRAAPWDESSVADWLAPRVVELVSTADDLEAFAQDMGFAGAPYRWDAARREILRAELDAAFFHLYEVDRADVDYVLETFPISRRKDEQAHGEYRTKRLILEVYDGLAEAINTGRPYLARLDPPPADPRLSHPPTYAHSG